MKPIILNFKGRYNSVFFLLIPWKDQNQQRIGI